MFIILCDILIFFKVILSTILYLCKIKFNSRRNIAYFAELAIKVREIRISQQRLEKFVTFASKFHPSTSPNPSFDYNPIKMAICCAKLDIIVHESYSEPKIEPPKPKPRLKWKFPWRINMLAHPKLPRKKYEPPKPRVRKPLEPLDPEVEFRSEQLYRPPIRLLMVNRELFKFKGDKFVKFMDKRIVMTWDTIYNFYAKQLREKRLKKLKRRQERKRLKRLNMPKKVIEAKEQERKDRLVRIATPKKIFHPPPIIRQKLPLEEIMSHVDALAEPMKHPVPPPKNYTKISKAALQYEITEDILKLTKEPEWRRNWVDNTVPLGVINPAAKRAKCTPRLEELAKPSLGRREAKKQEDDKFDPWAISPTALKYKPTPRILELAKPLERD